MAHLWHMAEDSKEQKSKDQIQRQLLKPKIIDWFSNIFCCKAFLTELTKNAEHNL